MTAFVSLAEMKLYLRMPNPDLPSADDFILGEYMESAADVITGEVGEVLQRDYDEWYAGGDSRIFLRRTPVVSISLVTENWGFTNYILSPQPADSLPAQTSLWAYSLDLPKEGMITRRSVGNIIIPFVNPVGGENIRIRYTAGRDTVPGYIRHAYMELVTHWWRNSQQRSTGLGMANPQFDTSVPDGTGSGYNAGIPYSVLEILRGGGRRTPVIG